MAAKKKDEHPPARSRAPAETVVARTEAVTAPASPPGGGRSWPRWLTGLVGVLGVGIILAVLFGSEIVAPMWERLRAHWAPAAAPAPEGVEAAAAYPRLERDAQGRPVLVISAEQARILGIGPDSFYTVTPAAEPRPLPAMEGQLNYDIEHLYSVRPRFPGEVVSFAQVPVLTANKGGAGPLTRDIGVGDVVQGPHRENGREIPGTLLAVIWSKDLGDKKAALIDALIDLHRDEDRLAKLKKGFEEGVVSESTFYEAKRTVQHDINAVNAAERTLRMWKLTDQEIADLYAEAARIEEAARLHQQRRDPRKETDWARVEVRAPHDGVIVEKNTNRGDWVDPAQTPNPMFKIADLQQLAVWINAREEYRDLLQQLLRGPSANRLEVRLLSAAEQPPLVGRLERIAPSLDPNLRTMLVVGRVSNPEGRLLVGQLVTATLYVPPGPDLVQVPTAALNEVDGQALVFVKVSAASSAATEELALCLKRVAIVQRFADVVLVRRQLSAAERALAEREQQAGRRPLEPLLPGEVVVTRGVPLLTNEVRDQLAAAAHKAASPAAP